MPSGQHQVNFIPSGRGKAQCAPDPNYPNGKAVRAPEGVFPVCKVTLPYPAPECGFFAVACTVCKTGVVITAAGRPDDPVSVEIPCTVASGSNA